MRGRLVDELRGVDVAVDAETLGLYARDRSPFVVEPMAVARVRSADEVAACVVAAARVGVPVTARAGGSSVAGQCLGSGLVVDTSLLGGVVLDGSSVWAGAGVGLDALNAALGEVMIGPDVTSSQWARVGGLVGTNACGSRSLLFGRFADALLEAEVVRADGSVSVLSRSSESWPSLLEALDGLGRRCLRRGRRSTAGSGDTRSTRSARRARRCPWCRGPRGRCAW